MLRETDIADLLKAEIEKQVGEHLFPAHLLHTKENISVLVDPYVAAPLTVLDIKLTFKPHVLEEWARKKGIKDISFDKAITK